MMPPPSIKRWASFAVVLASTLPMNLQAQCPGAWTSGFGSPGTNARVLALAPGNDGTGPSLFAGGDFTAVCDLPASRIARWNGVSWTSLGSGLDGPPAGIASLNDGSGPAVYVCGAFTFAGGVSVPGLAKWNGVGWSALPALAVVPQALAAFDDGTGPHLFAAGSYAPSGIMKLANGVWTPVPAIAGILSANVHALRVIDLGAGPRLYAVGRYVTSTGTFGFFGRWSGSAWEGGTVENTASPFSPEVGDVRTVAAFSTPAGPSVAISGQFTSLLGFAANNVACVFGPAIGPFGSGLVGNVNALADYDDGSGPALHAAGNFTLLIGGMVKPHVARWNGTQWTDVGGSLFCSQEAFALTTFDPGSGLELFVGGNFSSAPGVGMNGIARWTGTWSAVVSGTPAGIGPLPSRLTSATLPSGPALIASGNICFAGSTGTRNIAARVGTAWQPLGSGLATDVNAIEGFDDGTGPAIYAGSRDGVTGAFPLNRWDGLSWTQPGGALTWSGSPASSAFVHRLRAFDDGSGPALFVGGTFDHAGGLPVSNIARWNGTTWSALGGGIVNASLPIFGIPVSAMEVYDDGTGAALYVTGPFTLAGGQPAQQLAKWNGATWTAIPTGFTPAPLATLNTMAAFDDGSGPALWVAGNFSTIGGIPAPGIAKWNGQTWTAGVSPPSPGNQITVLKVLDDGSGPALHAIAYGQGPTIPSIRRWDGTTWVQLGSPFGGFPTGPTRAVYDLALHDDGSGAAIFATGNFTSVGGIPSVGIAKWATARPSLAISQAGPGSGVVISSTHLVPGNEYYNLFSTTPCPGLPGFGPYAGLCASDLSFLVSQFQLPIGATPFHFVAGSATEVFGPLLAPLGITVDAVCFDFTGAMLGCRSVVQRFAIQ